MNAYKEWYLEHIEECEYCNRVSESMVFSEDKKSDLIDAHATDAMADYGDMMYEIYKDS